MINPFDIRSRPLMAYDEYKQRQIVKNAYYDIESQQAFKNFRLDNDIEIRIDNIGRYYCVINLPEELTEPDKSKMAWAYVLDKLRLIDNLLLELRLSDLVFPQAVQDEVTGEFAWLIVLTPSSESLDDYFDLNVEGTKDVYIPFKSSPIGWLMRLAFVITAITLTLMYLL